jgi:outer membrane protein TolC
VPGNSYSNTAWLFLCLFTQAGELEGTVAKAKANYEAYVLGEHKSYMDLKKTTTDAYYTLLECCEQREGGTGIREYPG